MGRNRAYTNVHPTSNMQVGRIDDLAVPEDVGQVDDLTLSWLSVARPHSGQTPEVLPVRLYSQLLQWFGFGRRERVHTHVPNGTHTNTATCSYMLTHHHSQESSIGERDAAIANTQQARNRRCVVVTAINAPANALKRTEGTMPNKCTNNMADDPRVCFIHV